MRRRLLTISAALLAGCAMPNPLEAERVEDIPPEKIAAADALPELDGNKLAGLRYESLAGVAGVSCRRAWKGTPPSWGDAVRRTKYHALQLGGNAITELNCELPKVRSLTTLCLESIRCTARAIKTLE